MKAQRKLKKRPREAVIRRIIDDKAPDYLYTMHQKAKASKIFIDFDSNNE